MARCPAHDDTRPSLSLKITTLGKIVLNCHAGCTPEAVVAALGMTLADLFPPEPSRAGTLGSAIEEYTYTDEAGTALYQVVRFEPKDFRVRRADPIGGWSWGYGGVRRVLYRLPDVLHAVRAHQPIYAVEGEKDVERIRQAGAVATCNPGGAGKWRPEYSESLRGAQVLVVADRDDAGRNHARTVARELESVAATVRLLEPAAGKDVSDHLDAGGTLATLTEAAASGAPERQTERPRFRVLRVSELAELPAPEYLVEGVLPAAANGVLYGVSGTGKSFVALDWALSIASGQVSWMGRGLRPGPVVYVAAEGQAGLTQRIQAWMHANGVATEPDLYIIPDAVQLLDVMDGRALLDAIKARIAESPVLIILDTLAKCMPSGDENSTQDMGLVTASQDYLRGQTGAHVLFIHHPMKHGDLERGNSSLRAAQDVMLLLKSEDGYLTLESTKMRDGPALERLSLKLQPILESCVVVAVDGDSQPTERLTKLQMQALQSLDSVALSDGCSSSVWLAASGLKERTFYVIRKTLLVKDYVSKLARGSYTVSVAGRAILQLQTDCKRPANAVQHRTACTAPTLVEGGSDAVQETRGDAWEPEVAA
jgi:hypothetical protein